MQSFILGHDNELIKTTLLESIEWRVINDKRCQIRRSENGDILISTVFLGYGEYPFETMIDIAGTEVFKKHATYEDAVAYHNNVKGIYETLLSLQS